MTNPFSFGEKFRITAFGSSHGPSVGVEIEGCPRGVKISQEEIQLQLDRRKPGIGTLVSKRKEADKAIIESGIENGKTTGKKIRMLVKNNDTRPENYSKFSDTPRPGHADFTSIAKYGGAQSGGGFFSGRMTVAFVMAGAVAKKLLLQNGISTMAFSRQIGKMKLTGEVADSAIASNTYKNAVRAPDSSVAAEMASEIERAMKAGDSVGGIVECRITGVTAGTGEPMFGSLESRLSQAIFAIPGVKGIEFGSGFSSASMRGSEHNDEFLVKGNKIITSTNNAGGILGGLASGMPIVFRVAFKPTASIFLEQKTVSLKSMKPSLIKIEGRHDPCIAIRAVPVVENMAALCIADVILRKEGENET